MIILSRKDIENIAIRVEKAYIALPNSQYEDSLRVDIKRLCTDLLGLTVDHQRLSMIEYLDLYNKDFEKLAEGCHFFDKSSVVAD